MNITAFLPCRKGSQRVKEKNIKSFAGSSLFEIKIKQLLSIDSICNIIVSTDDQLIIDIIKKLDNDKIKIDRREAYYASSECSTDELINYVIDKFEFENLLWTHVTSPFVDETVYEQSIEKFISLKENDSLVSVEKIQDFIWDREFNSINYDRKKEGNWPMTQNIKPLYSVNSAIFLASKDIMKENRDRVGIKPYLFEMDRLKSIDIDWPEDFEIAEKIYMALN